MVTSRFGVGVDLAGVSSLLRRDGPSGPLSAHLWRNISHSSGARAGHLKLCFVVGLALDFADLDRSKIGSPPPGRSSCHPMVGMGAILALRLASTWSVAYRVLLAADQKKTVVSAAAVQGPRHQRCRRICASRIAQWLPADREILRARASQAADLMPDNRSGMRVYSDYIATLNL